MHHLQQCQQSILLWNVEGWFHGAIQNASQFKISSDKVLLALKKWKQSLEACASTLNLLIHYFEQRLLHIQAVSSHYVENASLWKQALYLEPAYEFFLNTLNATFDSLNSLRSRNFMWCNSQNERIREEIHLELDRWRFLQGYVEEHLKSIEEGSKAFEEWKSALSNKVEQNERLNLKNESLEYISKNIKDQKKGQTLYFYPDGAVKVEAFYQSGKLHGPWSFYSPNGLLLFHSLFISGKKEGECSAYYSTGALYGLKNYSEGMAQGRHLHYYPDGTLKTEENYDKGLLEGVVRLYYSNGLLKKEQHFIKGQLHGQERIWNVRGVLMIEASYAYGKTIGISKKWDSNGKLIRRVEHEDK